MTTTKFVNVTKTTASDIRDAFSIGEVASRYGVSPGLVRLEIARGRLRGVRISRRVVILKRDLEAWVNRQNASMSCNAPHSERGQ